MENSRANSMTAGFEPCAEQAELLKSLISGNVLNRRGEAEHRRPFPIYWQDPEDMPHGRLMLWYFQLPSSDIMAGARKRLHDSLDEPLAPKAPTAQQDTPQRWTEMVKEAALGLGAGDVGITQLRREWVYEGHEVNPGYRSIILLVVPMDFEKLRQAPGDVARCEVADQYANGTRLAIALASWIRARGWEAEGHCGYAAGHVLLPPHAIEAGLGELGKHGSMIHREFGSMFRLAAVMTDLPLEADAPAPFGADDFCLNCQVCTRKCPPGAISVGKQLVNGDNKWYVDFDKCIPYFQEHAACGICLAVCPWSVPGRAPRLAERAALRAAQRAGDFKTA